MVEAVPASCPKCGAPRRDEPACPRCGLRADRIAAFASERDAAVAQDVRVAWERVEAAWDDTTGHDELFRLTVQHACYAWTAARYREARTGKGAEGAEPHLDRVRRAAEATLLARARGPRDPARTPYRSTMLVLALMVIMIVLGLLFATVMRTGESSSVQPAPQVR